MATTVILPKQGQSVETCIITEWYKKKGDKVAIGDILFSYETDKASFEEEAAVEGVLLDVFYDDGDEVPVLAEVAVIGEPGEAVERPIAFGTDAGPAPAPEPSPLTAEISAATAATATIEAPAPSPEATGGRIRISPRARRMAADKGILIENMTGSGPNGRIIVRDIEALAGTGAPAPAATAAPAPAAAPEKPAPQPPVHAPKAAPAKAHTEDSETRPLSNIRKLIANAMFASLQNSAQLTHHLSADARKILSLRSKVKKMQAEGYEYNITLNYHFQ